MTVGRAIRTGLRAARRNAWLVVIFYASNLLLAAIVAAPMYDAIRSHLGHSATAQRLADGFDLGWLIQFQLASGDLLSHTATLVAWMGVLFLALNTILSAGAFELFAHPHDARLGTFGYGIGRFFFSFARLALLASALYYVAFLFWNVLLADVMQSAFRNSVHEAPLFYLTWLRWALLFATVFVINAIVEYAKADLVLDDHGSALGALGHAAGFVFARFGRVMAIYLFLGLLTTLTIFVYAAFARFFPQSGVVTIFIWFVVAQLLLFLRWMFRLASWAAELTYYRRGPDPDTLPIEAQVEPV
jgi:hypothetical protein